jgi:hypothetical protein
MPREFTLNVNDIVYFIKPVCDVDYIYYEVSTDREKLFTLQLFADGHWKTVEDNIVPIYGELLDNIGNAILRHGPG